MCSVKSYWVSGVLGTPSSPLMFAAFKPIIFAPFSISAYIIRDLLNQKSHKNVYEKTLIIMLMNAIRTICGDMSLSDATAIGMTIWTANDWDNLELYCHSLFLYHCSLFFPHSNLFYFFVSLTISESIYCQKWTILIDTLMNAREDRHSVSYGTFQNGTKIMRPNLIETEIINITVIRVNRRLWRRWRRAGTEKWDWGLEGGDGVNKMGIFSSSSEFLIC